MIAAAAAPGLTPEELRASATRLMRGRRPLSVEHLLALAGEEGTHSILDMFGLGDGFGEVAPLDLSEYDRLFGTLTPTMKQVKARKRELMRLRDRWMGTYVVVDRGGLPSGIVFTGFSGD